MKKKIHSAKRVLQEDGLIAAIIVGLEKVQQRRRRKSETKKQKIRFLAKYEDIQKADWSNRPYQPKKNKKRPPYKLNWVMSPPGKGIGGGHQNIFRFVDYLERHGHDCTIYLYSDKRLQTAEDAERIFRASYPNSKTPIRWLDGQMRPADAVFASGWETAYPVFNDPGKASKFYFVQDFEPYFHPIGSEYILAENTYRMNFHGITAGGWLAHKLRSDYGMKCDQYEFATDTNLYSFENTEPRKEVFFYARPVTARRGFELGILALEIFHQEMPDYTINLAGWDVSDYDIPFPHNNLKSLPLNQLSGLYNRCAAALVISLTNMSLLPLELLSCGTIPVINRGDNNTMVTDNSYITYADSSPAALAAALVATVKRSNLPAYAAAAAKSVAGMSWEASGQQVESILERGLNG